MLKFKVCNTKEEYIGLMQTLEKYKFHWRCGQTPTDEEVFEEIGYFPVKIYFGYWNDGCKKLTYGH